MPDILSPIDGRVAYGYAELSFETALAKIEQAETVQRSWAQTPISERVALCQRMLEGYRARLPEYSEQITRMMGKPLAHARGEFRGPMRERTLALCDMAEAALADHVLAEKPGFRRFIRREPVGTVLDIAAWNYPLIIAINVVVPAVIAGDAVVIKHAHQTMLVADQLEQAFVAAGAPAGLVQAMPVSHVTVAELIAKRRFGFVAFTGSVRGGHEVYRTVARENFVGVGLELGGKDPALVLPDCDFDHAVENLVDGAFFNAGQSCCGIERVYVHADLYDRFVEAYVAKTREYKLGNPLEATTNLGPVVNPAAAERIRAQIQQALAGGARALVSSSDFFVPDLGRCYVAPHVLVDVTHDMDVMNEETFGPVMLLCRVRDEHHAVEVANGTGFGLSSSVFGRDRARARRISERLHAGMTAINDFGGMTYMAQDLTFGGIKQSGFGRINGREGLRACCNVKAVLDDRLPVSFPSKLYPVAEGDFERLRATMRLVYGHGVRGRLQGAMALVRSLRGRK